MATLPLSLENLNTRQDTCVHATLVVPSDTTQIANGAGVLPKTPQYLYVGVTGDITLDTMGGETQTLFKAVPAGTFLRVRPIKIWATGTTATQVLALY